MLAILPPWAELKLEPTACELEARRLERQADTCDTWAVRPGVTPAEMDRLFDKAAQLRLEARVIRGSLD